MSYTHRPDGDLAFEGTRPGPGWHRHDWRPRTLTVIDDHGTHTVVVHRRRWLLNSTTTTRLDRCPDEMGGVGAVLLVVMLKLASWLLSGVGLNNLAREEPTALARAVSPRTAQRWLHRLLPDAAVVQGGLRIAVVERSEPQPIERLFPGGVSPPEAIRRRRWKAPEAVYRLATGLVFLVCGAEALNTSATTLLAEAQLGDAGTLGTPRS